MSFALHKISEGLTIEPFNHMVQAILITFMSENPSSNPLVNAVLDDFDLQNALSSIHPAFGDFCTRAAGEAWGKPAVSQRTKAFITIAIDVVNQAVEGPGAPFEAHLMMALKQGATYEEIEEVLLFTCVYAGFNKAALAFGRWGEIRARHEQLAAQQN